MSTLKHRLALLDDFKHHVKIKKQIVVMRGIPLITD